MKVLMPSLKYLEPRALDARSWLEEGRMTGSRMRVVSRTAAAVLLSVFLGGDRAEASGIDLTIAWGSSDAFSFGPDPGDFGASCAICVLSWTDPDGNFGGPELGPASLTWDESLGAGVFSVEGLTFLLEGDVTNFIGNGSGGFVASVDLTTRALGFGNTVRVVLDQNVAMADVLPVPESSGLAVTLAGLAALAVGSRFWPLRRG